MRKKTTKKVKVRYSVLCQKRAKLTDACVFVKEHNVWAVVKGKQYADGRFKYLYNGREGICDSYQYVLSNKNAPKNFLKKEAIKFNLQFIQQKRSRKKKKILWDPVLNNSALSRTGSH